MIINILAGGPKRYIPDLAQYTNHHTIWAGADRGVYELLRRNIIPEKAFGDFDSIDEKEFMYLQGRLANINVFPSEKDETDLELALNWALSMKPERIQLFGATGGRLDHLLGNIQLLLKGYEAQIEIEMIDTQNYAIIKYPGTHVVYDMPQYPYISFLPMSEIVENITLEGFKYPLINHQIGLGSTLCISNELIDKRGTFSFESGILIMVRSHD